MKTRNPIVPKRLLHVEASTDERSTLVANTDKMVQLKSSGDINFGLDFNTACRCLILNVIDGIFSGHRLAGDEKDFFGFISCKTRFNKCPSMDLADKKPNFELLL